MTIAVQINPAFDIETFDGLVAYIIAHLELDAETALQVPTFIRKGEYRLNRLVTAPERETGVQLATVAGEQAISLPVDYRQLKNARFVADTGQTLEQVAIDQLHNRYTNTSGRPGVYAISEQSLLLGPVPDGVYTIDLTYMARIPPITSTNQTNWLLSSNADAYVYSTLWQAAAWLEDFDAAVAFRSELMEIIGELNLSGNRYRRSSPMRLRSPVVV